MSVTISLHPTTLASEPELNLSNNNFSTYWNALGLPLENHCGSIDGQEILDALDRLDPQLVVRATSYCGKIISCGITLPQVKRYNKLLREIAEEAANTDTEVQWS